MDLANKESSLEPRWYTSGYNTAKTLQVVKPRLYDTTCCQTGLTTGWMFVYTTQPVIKPVVQPV